MSDASSVAVGIMMQVESSCTFGAVYLLLVTILLAAAFG